MTARCTWKTRSEQCSEAPAAPGWAFCYRHYLRHAHLKGFTPLPEPLTPEQLERRDAEAVAAADIEQNALRRIRAMARRARS